MSTYSEFFLGSPKHVAHLELVEISHFRFTQTYRFCRNCKKTGITVTHEVGGDFAYQYMPMTIRRLGSTNNMDQVLRISIADVGKVLPVELKAVMSTNGMRIKPILKYRAYSSAALGGPMFGPAEHEVSNINFTKTGVSFDATSQRLNITRTGILYEVKTFPMMKTFFKNGL